LSFPLCATNINKGNVRAVLPMHPCGALVLLEALLGWEEGIIHPSRLLSSTGRQHRPQTLHSRRGEGEERATAAPVMAAATAPSILLCLPQPRGAVGVRRQNHLPERGELTLTRTAL